jgi:hypothetical protein
MDKLIIIDEISLLRGEVTRLDELLSKDYIGKFIPVGVNRYINARLIIYLSDVIKTNNLHETISRIVKELKVDINKIDNDSELERFVNMIIFDKFTQIVEKSQK